MNFELTGTFPLNHIQATLETYRDNQSGLLHLHIHREDVENSFLFAFPTRPNNDCGEAHVLEHLSLASSAAFPQRAPFFGMLSRTMASFINAMTHKDLTVYPFATPDKKDFFNLLDVYTNAVFFPTLNRLDFLQEGWRPVLDEKDRLSFDGVVFNEMKGAVAGGDRFFNQALSQPLNTGTSRKWFSGGDPLSIPFLTHEDLVAFHENHYHPSRAIMLSYGTLSPSSIQNRVSQWVSRKIWKPKEVLLPEFSTFAGGLRQQLPFEAAENLSEEHRFSKLWLLPDEEDVSVSRMEAAIMSRLLLGPGCPVITALEQAGMGRAGPCSIDDQGVEISAVLSLYGLKESEVVAAEKLIDETLKRVADNGVSAEEIKSVLRSFEIEHRAIDGGNYPFGTSLLMNAALSYLRGRDPVTALNPFPSFETMSRRLENPEYVKEWVRRHLIENKRYLCCHGVPDNTLSSKRDEKMAALLKTRELALTPKDKAQIRQDMAALDERQKIVETQALPFIRPADISTVPVPVPDVTIHSSSPTGITIQVSTNGLTNMQLVMDVGGFSLKDQKLLTQIMGWIPQLGMAGKSWDETARWLSERGEGYHGEVMNFSPVSHPSAVGFQAIFSGHGLTRESAALCEALTALWQESSLSDVKRIQYLVSSRARQIQQSISQLGPHLARTRALQHLVPSWEYAASTEGVEGVREMLAFNETLSQNADLALAPYRDVHQQLKKTPVQLRVVSEDPTSENASFARYISNHPRWSGVHSTVLVPASPPAPAQTVFLDNTAVNYVFQVFAAPRQSESQAATAMVLAKLLSSAVLHPSIREKGGAYGGGLYYLNGALVFRSYRDPRLSGTLDDFEKAIGYAIEGRFKTDSLDEAILATVRDFDPPRIPFEAAGVAIYRATRGLTSSMRKETRERILSTSISDIQSFASQWLANQSSSRVVFAGRSFQDEALRCGLVEESIFVPPPSLKARTTFHC